MANATERFFDELARRGHEPLLDRADGTLRFDLVDAKRTHHWYVRINKGDVDVSRDEGDSDCVVAANTALFDSFTSGEANAMAAFLRGELAVSGDPQLLMRFQRVFPGPVDQIGAGTTTHDPRRHP